MHSPDQLVNALVAAGTHCKHWQPEGLSQAAGIDCDAELPRFVAHVQRHYRRDGQGFELQ